LRSAGLYRATHSKLASGHQTLQPAQIGPQGVRHVHRTVGLLVVFEHGHQGAAYG